MFESRIETNKTGEEKTMLRKNQKYVLLVTVLFTIASLVAACGTAATPAPATQPSRIVAMSFCEPRSW